MGDLTLRYSDQDLQSNPLLVKCIQNLVERKTDDWEILYSKKHDLIGRDDLSLPIEVQGRYSPSGNTVIATWGFHQLLHFKHQEAMDQFGIWLDDHYHLLLGDRYCRQCKDLEVAVSTATDLCQAAFNLLQGAVADHLDMP